MSRASVICGDAGAMEKLSLESALRDTGMDFLDCVSITNLWYNVVFLGCVYDVADYERVVDSLRLIVDRELRLSVCSRFLVALGRLLKDDGGILSNLLWRSV
jgi:hypothetical protein